MIDIFDHPVEMVSVGDMKPAKYNPRRISDKMLEKLIDGIREFGIVEPVVINRDGTVIGGHQRLKAIKEMIATGELPKDIDVPCVRLDLDEHREKALNLALNKISGEWDFDLLSGVLRDLGEIEMPNLTGFDDAEIDALIKMDSTFDPTSLIDTGSIFDTTRVDPATAASPGSPSTTEGRTEMHDRYDPAKADHGAMVRKYIVPPFSTLDARQGYWKDRKQYWMDVVGIDTVEGRDEMHSTVDMPEYAARGERFGGSSFDPVLAEVIFNWFCPPGGKILDPFGGESTKGIVAAASGYEYNGVELRPEQCEANARQWESASCRIHTPAVAPTWTCGDSARIDELVPAGEWADLIFTSPPYYDLEIYSESEKDGSAFETYEKFMEWYEGIFKKAVACLKPNRFVAVKIGELRDPNGFYRNFLGDNITCFLNCGLKYYNEAVLITPVGSLPIRAPRPFNQSRKLAKAHQNILVFYKGDDIKDIQNDFGSFDDASISE